MIAKLTFQMCFVEANTIHQTQPGKIPSILRFPLLAPNTEEGNAMGRGLDGNQKPR